MSCPSLCPVPKKFSPSCLFGIFDLSVPAKLDWIGHLPPLTRPMRTPNSVPPTRPWTSGLTQFPLTFWPTCHFYPQLSAPRTSSPTQNQHPQSLPSLCSHLNQARILERGICNQRWGPALWITPLSYAGLGTCWPVVLGLHMQTTETSFG